MADKLDPWSSEVAVKDYGKLEKEFGIEPMEPLLPKIPDPLIYMNRGILFGHRDFGRVLEAISKKKTWLNIKNKALCRLPFFLGRAGPYNFIEKEI